MSWPPHSSTASGWRPKLIALDIDGTLLAWIEGLGQTLEVVTEPVRDSIRRAAAAGAHIVLASGRSAHAMTPVADALGLPLEDQGRLWIVASNGAVVTRYPPLEVVHEEVFDARDAVSRIVAARPEVLVAVEERGLGYRVNRPFPEGELTGEQIVTTVEEMVADPVARVVIRDPDSSPEDFMELGREVGLEGISYHVGWTAWLDLAPIGISKAAGLAYVLDELDLKPTDVLAIGDGRNDIEMLEWAGRGVAMGQATDDVKEVADAITLPVEEDGAAVEIDRWFPTGG
ncbi:HAD family hydrolase [Nocardioides sp. Kera G14]|uniref:HAD family hydrolase n=1 Tax=Nocardioides sp. Kera G14 TaxID=2884264 RepID=UPI001D0F6E38|nr:HAD family hydrolase [Nocardioides sp. Kera G14]UDY23350.1 Cof-type HAD-IIB family hydrolase [Nocardioides sp. Kera G14]